jgi:arabinogalactan oligomer/maltooligosaccharide transport system permease protein
VVALVSALLIMFAQSALAKDEIVIAIFLFVATLAIVWVYLANRSVPLKFFLPGLLLLIAFVVTPIAYTLTMSGYIYKTGNYISKSEALERLQSGALAPDPANSVFDITAGKDSSGNYAILVTDITTGRFFISTPTELIDIEPSKVTTNEIGVATSAPGFTALAEAELAGSDFSTLRYRYQDEYFIKIETLNSGAVYRQSLEYLPEQDIFKSLITGDTYADDGRGNYANTNNPDERLEPGWRTPSIFENYSRLIADERVRDPIFRVFIWTCIFAGLTVLTQFAFGLLLAIALNKQIRGRRVYRSILVLPYAMPSIMSILIWGGMFDTEFGAINQLLGTDIAWFQNATFARFAVILVNLWLGFPYFYLVSSGALQAIPSELSEAAAIDGASPRQIFRRVTLPLLLQILTPLLIASFAFNFNNFNLIYLLTGGGPKDQLSGEIAGATDILISYTYQIAFGSNVQDLGLASAISVLIFIIIATISLYGVRKSKVLDSFS